MMTMTNASTTTTTATTDTTATTTTTCEVCPMPSRRKSKEFRSKVYSFYLRPWTLLRTQATLDVPFLGHLHYARTDLANMSSNVEEEVLDPESGSIRKAWKEYTRQALPHAFTQVRNFMLASIAEGRNFDEVVVEALVIVIVIVEKLSLHRKRN